MVLSILDRVERSVSVIDTDADGNEVMMEEEKRTFEDGYEAALNEVIHRLAIIYRVWERDKANVPKPDILSAIAIVSLLKEV